MAVQNLILALTLLVLAGCSGTTVVLVPNDVTGKVGEVTLKNQAGSQTLTQANQRAEVTYADRAPEQPVALTDQEVYAKFGKLLAKQPQVPLHFTLLFGSGEAVIAEAYKPLLEKIAAAIKTRKPCYVSAIGHTDTQGDYASNHELSVKRAHNARDALISLGVDSACIDPRDYGEYDLAVQTPDNVAHQANRRVEIEIR